MSASRLRRALALAVVLALLWPPPAVLAQGTCSVFRSWSTGDSLTASDLTSSFTTVGQTNMTFACLDDYSSTAAQMQTTTDPNSTGTASLATTGAGELERLRFTIGHALGFVDGGQWWQHYRDINFRHRMVRQHFTTLTGFQQMFRGEAHLSAASTRFHLVGISTTEYVAGAAHPESMLLLAHVNGTLRFGVTIGGDTHVGSTLRVHAAGSRFYPVLFQTDAPTTGVYFPAVNHIALSTNGNHLATFHGYGMILAAHQAVAFRHAAGGVHVTGLSLAAGDQVRVGDANTALTVRGAGLTTGANRLLGFNVSDTGLEAKALSGAGVTIAHTASVLTITADSRILARHVTAVNVVNTTARTNIYSFSVPANTLSTNKAIRLTLIGDYLNNSGAGSTLTVGVVYGGTTLFLSTATSYATGATRRGVQLDILLSAANATNAQVARGRLWVGAVGTGSGTAGAIALDETATQDTVAIDSTAAQNLDVYVIHGTAAATISAQLLALPTELL